MAVVTSCKNTLCKDQDIWQEIQVRDQIPHFPEGYDYQFLSSPCGVARGGGGFQGFWNPPLGYETGCNFKQRRKKNQKGIASYIEGYSIVSIMHLSMVCPRMGGLGNPRELDFVKGTWVGILTSTTVPRVGNLTQPPSWKVERTWEWVSGPPPWKIPRSHLSKFPAFKDGWTKGKEYRLLFFKQKRCFLCPSVLCP